MKQEKLKLKFEGSLFMLFLGTWLWSMIAAFSLGILTPLALYVFIHYMCKRITIVREV